MQQTSINDSFAQELYDFCLEMNNKDLKGEFLLKNFEPNLNPSKKLFSITAAKCPIEGIEITDLRIQRIFFEDDAYLRYDDIYSNMRRGLSLILNTTIEQKKTFTIARIGLPKFFDYKPEYSIEEELMRKRVMAPIEKAKGPFEVYLTEKANGEHIQISFNSKHQAWIIASKNVSILARDELDLEWYNKASSSSTLTSTTKKHKPKERYTACIEYARKWFKIINESIKGSIDQFKHELADHTLIGEFVGDSKHQHVKLYAENDVIFYAIVNNTKAKEQFCLPLNEAFAVFKAYNLTFVSYELSKQFMNHIELKEYMAMMFNKILMRSIEDGGEGCVAYFVSVSDAKEQVINLCKLKTYEYLFYRLIREKMKKIIEKKLSPSEANEIIKQESLSILNENKDNTDLEAYFKLSSYVFQYATRDSTSYSIVWAKFISEMKSLLNDNIPVESIDTKNMRDKLFNVNSNSNSNSKSGFKNE